MASSVSAEGGKQGGLITRQTSIYSLTLDEFQNALGEPGKNFGSMNMDEFLKNIWTAEESQAMAAAMGAGGEGGAAGLFRQPSLQRQPSINLPGTLSRKTVDDVWKDIHRTGDSNGGNTGEQKQQRQMTFGEMTLEDFLIKAGVMREDGTPCAGNAFQDKTTSDAEGGDKGALSLAQGSAPALDSMAANQQAEWLSNQYGNAAMAAMAQQQQQQQQQFLQQQAVEVAAYMNAKAISNGGPIGPGALTALGAVGSNLGIGLGPSMGVNGLGLGSGSPPSPGSDSQGNGFGLSSYGFDGRGRKRGLEGPVEVVLERRQRRMIKNRESAARSRARKQAYTVELEAEVTHLKEENMRLKKQQEEAELRDRKRNQVLEVIVAKTEANLTKPKPLRRTLTGPW